MKYTGQVIAGLRRYVVWVEGEDYTLSAHDAADAVVQAETLAGRNTPKRATSVTPVLLSTTTPEATP